jgi:exodeoxyribonuclease VIII
MTCPKLIHHPGLSNEDSHALKAVSPSGIKLLKRSPLHFKDAILAYDRIIKKPTPEMLKGTATHTAILEPQLWDTTVVVVPALAPKRPTKAQLQAKTPSKETQSSIQWWQEFDASTAGRIVLGIDDADEVRRMADAVRAHPAARFLLDMPGRREASYTYTDAATGVECKTRPDWHSLDGQIVVDVKTAQDASREAFAKSIANFDYHVQAAWNLDAQGGKLFLSLVVESSRPYGVAVYPASEAMLEAGRRRISSAMESLAECWKTGHWPGYGDAIQEPLDLPGWVKD